MGPGATAMEPSADTLDGYSMEGMMVANSSCYPIRTDCLTALTTIDLQAFWYNQIPFIL
ncbi:uncharacterized protein ANIA_11275 [Aspergillus nidulans FGSC A4]|uniref:Uncharacterized protein n=1 Tax=Emericella nidulans (strain FGSC A4 / ATCC 38163 / CBS 112.46 / NRRL 194 / M139) TaxID=227321 RepID=C8VSE1_EMENI|nr:hypothetical protein [Aspergillus nidulans FGSC A4]CBF89216.1 TPA: hypothetical protein ANIA_11275 [Aspergillus nidulans FGSC A4]